MREDTQETYAATMRAGSDVFALLGDRLCILPLRSRAVVVVPKQAPRPKPWGTQFTTRWH